MPEDAAQTTSWWSDIITRKEKIYSLSDPLLSFNTKIFGSLFSIPAYKFIYIDSTLGSYKSKN